MNRLAALAACAALVDAPASVVFTEIHYHPVEAAWFLADGTPALDLGEDAHEFVEVHNPDPVAVDLGGWSLTGGITYTFPPGTVLAPGAFRAVARDPARLAAVYGLPPASALGPYAGTLGNNGDTVRLRDAGGATVEAVSYSSRFPWAMSADALGAQERFTGLVDASWQHKGRSLQRVSVGWNANDPANWLASSLAPGPTPGAAQTVTRAAPKPVVISLSLARSSDGTLPVRPGDAVTVRAVFSAGAAPSSVQVQWFADNVNATSETRSTAVMTALGNGAYQASLPGQPARTALRYRIRANRGDGLEVVSPRADDPQVAPGTRDRRRGRRPEAVGRHGVGLLDHGLQRGNAEHPAGGRARVLRTPAGPRTGCGRSGGHRPADRAEQKRLGRAFQPRLAAAGTLPRHGLHRAAAVPEP